LSNLFYDRPQLDQTKRKLLRAYSLLALAAVITLTVYILSFTLHSFWITFAAGCIGLCGSIFVYFFAVSPVGAEHALIREILLGKQTTEQLTYLSDGGMTEREGVPCRILLMQDTDEKGRLFERPVYAEARLELPVLLPGEALELTTYQNIITSLKRI